MKEVTLAQLKEAANRLLFDMSEGEYKTLLHEFKTITAQMKIISEDPEIDSYEPMVYPFPCEVNALREDETIKPTSRDEILKNAKNKLAGQVKVMKVNS